MLRKGLVSFFRLISDSQGRNVQGKCPGGGVIKMWYTPPLIHTKLFSLFAVINLQACSGKNSSPAVNLRSHGKFRFQFQLL